MMSHRDIKKKGTLFFKNANSGQKKNFFLYFQGPAKYSQSTPFFSRVFRTLMLTIL